MEKRKSNMRIIQTKITDKIRVSTAGIYYENDPPGFGERYQFETWCFSDDDRQRSFQVIHGSWYRADRFLLTKAIKIHRQISKNLKERFNQEMHLMPGDFRVIQQE